MSRLIKNALRKRGVKFTKEKNGDTVQTIGRDKGGNVIYRENKTTKKDFQYDINIDLPFLKVHKTNRN